MIIFKAAREVEYPTYVIPILRLQATVFNRLAKLPGVELHSPHALLGIISTSLIFNLLVCN